MLEVSLITGRLALEASDSRALVDAYASDSAVEEALAQGIADALDGIDASMVDIIDVAAGRRLQASPRLLSAGIVIVEYKLAIPANGAVDLNSTMNSLLGSQDPMQASIEIALSGVIAPQVTITSVVALEPPLLVRSSDKSLFENATEVADRNASLGSSGVVVHKFVEGVASEDAGAASAGILTGVVGGLLVATAIAVLIVRRSRLCKYPTAAKASACAHPEEGELDLEQGDGDSGGDVDEVAVVEEALQVEVSEVTMSVVDDVAADVTLQTKEADMHPMEHEERPAGSSNLAEVMAVPEDDAPFMPSSISVEPLATWRGFFQHASIEDKAHTDTPFGPHDGVTCGENDFANVL